MKIQILIEAKYLPEDKITGLKDGLLIFLKNWICLIKSFKRQFYRVSDSKYFEEIA
jgi:hypothetical protein